MVSTRNRILNLVEYIESLGVIVNIGKNKARGNKGFFKANGDQFRIDIASNLDEESILSILVHEFSHYIHYTYDKTLNTLDFILENQSETLIEEMISLTVELISKESATSIFKEKNSLKSKIKNCSTVIKNTYPDFKPSEHFLLLENKIKKTKYKCLLKHDAVKIINLFSTESYSLKNLTTEKTCLEPEAIEYLWLKSHQRKLKNLNSKISRLNKYYNSKTELFARSIEFYVTKNSLMETKAPNLKRAFDAIIFNEKIPLLSKMIKICNISI